jgi:hypothetical protein
MMMHSVSSVAVGKHAGTPSDHLAKKILNVIGTATLTQMVSNSPGQDITWPVCKEEVVLGIQQSSHATKWQ